MAILRFFYQINMIPAKIFYSINVFSYLTFQQLAEKGVNFGQKNIKKTKNWPLSTRVFCPKKVAMISD